MIDQKNSAQNIIGIGVDAVEISRINNTLEKHGTSFQQKIYTTKEIEYCEKYNDPIPHYAARFCAKEALSKALGTGICKDLGFLDIQITSQENKKPLIELIGKAKQHFSNPSFDISLTHTDGMAIAFIIAYAN